MRADTTATSRSLLCPRCGYDLRAIQAGRCPECGFGYDHTALMMLSRCRARFGLALNVWVIAHISLAAGLLGAPALASLVRTRASDLRCIGGGLITFLSLGAGCSIYRWLIPLPPYSWLAGTGWRCLILWVAICAFATGVLGYFPKLGVVLGSLVLARAWWTILRAEPTNAPQPTPAHAVDAEPVCRVRAAALVALAALSLLTIGLWF